MLTRLQVDGFKNLRDLDLRFGPLTCVAGPNGVGKSNIFDAIGFLAALADKPLLDAARAVRGGEGRSSDLRSLFRREGETVVDRMSFSAELLIPKHGADALGQLAEASMTFLRYDLHLGYAADPSIPGLGKLVVLHEAMDRINKGEARAHLRFKHRRAWRDSVVRGRRTSPYISTEILDGEPVIALHADAMHGKGGGTPRRLRADTLPRTVLSSADNAAEHRTLVLARREMASWMQLQLEPSALRAPDSFTAPRALAPNGAHLPATLHALAQAAEHPDHVFTRVASRLRELVDDVRGLRVDIDQRRQLLHLLMTDRHGTEHPASSLSDGTLRFLALAVMEQDERARRLVCLEEPENGMHPARITAVLRLLRDLAVDPDEAVDDDNPLRQVIINTHSPTVVGLMNDDELVMARRVQVYQRGRARAWLAAQPLAETWRCAEPVEAVPRGELIAYLNPHGARPIPQAPSRAKPRRVLARTDMQLPLPGLKQ